MAGDDDISRLLPRPPLPAPARRDAAIAQALRRFDGEPAAAPAAARPTRAQPWWTRRNGPAAGAFVAAGVAALIALPLAISNMPGAPTPDGTATQAPPPILADAGPAPAQPGGPPPDAGPVQALPPASPPTGDGDFPQTAVPSSTPAPLVQPARIQAPAGQPMPAPPPPAERMALAEAPAAPSQDIVVSGSRIARPELSATAPVAVVAEETMEEEAGAIVVTGTARRVSRGDWNACTVADPARNLAACRPLIDRSASRPRGRAADHLADGLAQAWQGELDQAIAAFDRAIAADPRSASAYLNRALARQQRGDEVPALADLDRAIALAPRSARLYYHRALLLRQSGDADRARADEARAIRLDRRYAPLLRPGR
jgi:Flp pilus assembly protein TadD